MSDNKRKELSIDEKINLFKEYMVEVGMPISQSTVFKGYNLGSIYYNLRQQYWNDKLPKNVTQKHVEELKQLGIFNRVRSRRVSRENMIALIEKYASDHPGEEIKGDTVDENGNRIGKYLNWLTVLYNRELKLGKDILSDDIRDKLEQNRFFSLEKVKTVKKYGELKFPEVRTVCERIVDIYDKTGYIIHFHSNGNIPLGSISEMGNEHKKVYNISRFLGEFCDGNDVIEGVDGVDRALGNLTDIEADMISTRFGLTGNSPMLIDDMVEGNKRAKERVRQKIARGMIKLNKLTNRNLIMGNVSDVCKKSILDWAEKNFNLEYYFDKNLNRWVDPFAESLDGLAKDLLIIKDKEKVALEENALNSSKLVDDSQTQEKECSVRLFSEKVRRLSELKGELYKLMQASKEDIHNDRLEEVRAKKIEAEIHKISEELKEFNFEH